MNELSLNYDNNCLRNILSINDKFGPSVEEYEYVGDYGGELEEKETEQLNSAGLEEKKTLNGCLRRFFGLPSKLAERVIEVTQHDRIVSKESFEIKKIELPDLDIKDLRVLVHSSIDESGKPLTQAHVMEYLIHGHFKQMYRAVEIETGKLRAITLTNKCQRATQRELQAAKLVNGIKGCVGTKQVVVSEQQVALITSYCDQGTLTTHLRRWSQEDDFFPLNRKREMIYIASQLADIIADLHAKDLIHNDIKPDNIMRKSIKPNKRQEGKYTYTMRLIDFGALSTLSRKELFLGDLTCGSPECVEKVKVKWQLTLTRRLFSQARQSGSSGSPETSELKSECARLGRELANKKKAVGKANDVWAVGLILLELNGQNFFPWKQQIATATHIHLTDPSAGILGLEKAKEKMCNYVQFHLPKPTDKESFQHLAWEMLRPLPGDRPTMAQASARLQSLFTTDVP